MRVYYIARKYWNAVVKGYVRQMSGAELQFDVLQHAIEANREPQLPAEVTV